MKVRTFAAIIVMIPMLAFGQSIGTINGPSLGYVFDTNAGSVRPLTGIAGSATIGGTLNLGYAITSAISLPDERYILAATQEGSNLVTANLSVDPPLTRIVPGASNSSDISLSPNGRAAAISVPGGNLIQVVTGLPDKPEVTLEISTSALPAAQPHRAIVNDDSSVLLVSFMDNGRENIYRWNGTEGFRFLASTAQLGGMMFLGQSDAIFADRDSNEVFAARDVNRASITQFIAGPEDGVSNPIAIAASGKSGFYVANAGSNSILIFDNLGSLLRSEACSCTISGLFRQGSHAFRLTDALNQTIYIFEDNGVESRILFVPPVPSTPSAL
jgi:hypothetical protein